MTFDGKSEIHGDSDRQNDNEVTGKVRVSRHSDDDNQLQ